MGVRHSCHTCREKPARGGAAVVIGDPARSPERARGRRKPRPDAAGFPLFSAGKRDGTSPRNRLPHRTFAARQSSEKRGVPALVSLRKVVYRNGTVPFCRCVRGRIFAPGNPNNETDRGTGIAFAPPASGSSASDVSHDGLQRASSVAGYVT